jgi:hypothetical protein
VEADVRDGVADLVQQRGPLEALARSGAGRLRLLVERARHRRDALGVRPIDAPALLQALAGRRADVLLHGAAEEVVQDAEPHRAAHGIDARHVELGQRGRHDREAARQHGRALGLQARQLQPPHVAGADQAPFAAG